MVSIAEYTQQVRSRPARQQGVSVRTNAQSFGAGIGQGFAAIGGGLSAAAEALDYRDAVTADASAREAFNQYMTEQRTALYDPEEGFLTRTGGNAIGNREDAQARLEKLRNQIGSNLSPRALKAFNEQVDGLQQQADQSVVVNEATQTRAYVVNESKATIKGFAEEAAVNWNNPDLFDTNLQAALTEQANLAEVQGWDSATLGQANEALVSNTYVQRAYAMYADDNTNVRQVQDFLEANQDSFLRADYTKLTDAIKGEVVKYDAAEWSNQYLSVTEAATTTAGSGGTDDYMSRLSNAESSGNPDAAAAGSSAAGLYGFTAGTFYQTVQDMAAQGTGAEAELARSLLSRYSEAEIKAMRSGEGNAAVQREVAVFFRAQNQAALAGAGVRITPATEYMAHFFGRGVGPRAASIATSNPNMNIFDVYRAAFPDTADGRARSQREAQKAIDANPTILNGASTAATMMAFAERKMGNGTGAGAVTFDYQSAMRDALLIDDPIKQAAAIDAANARRSAIDDMRTAEQGDARREAWNNYLEQGVWPTLDQQAAMGQANLSAFTSSAEQYELGFDLTTTETWDTLTNLRETDPSAFAKLDLTDYFPTMSRQDQRGFAAMQDAVTKSLSAAAGDNTSAEAINFSKIFRDAGVDAYYEASVVGGYDSNKASQEEQQNRLAFIREMQRSVMNAYNSNLEKGLPPMPTQVQIAEMATALLMPTTLAVRESGMIYGTNVVKAERNAFNINDAGVVSATVNVAYEDLPQSERAIAADFMVAIYGDIGIDVSAEGLNPDEVANAYEAAAFLRTGQPPHVDISEVPSEFISDYRAKMAELGTPLPDGSAAAQLTTNAYQQFLVDAWSNLYGR